MAGGANARLILEVILQAFGWLRDSNKSRTTVGAVDLARGIPVSAFGDPLPIPPKPPEGGAIPGAALVLIKHYEKCAKKLADGTIAPYQDDVGVWTIGWGNTRWEDGRPVRGSDKPITQEVADALYEFWIRDFDKRVRAALKPGYSEAARAAFLSFAWNVGIGGYLKSTALVRYNKGDTNGAAEAMEMWNKGGGRVLKGLQRRRRAEGLVLKGWDPDVAVDQAERAFP